MTLTEINQRIRDGVAQRKSYGIIAEELNKSGAKTLTGRPFNMQAVWYYYKERNRTIRARYTANTVPTTTVSPKVIVKNSSSITKWDLLKTIDESSFLVPNTKKALIQLILEETSK